MGFCAKRLDTTRWDMFLDTTFENGYRMATKRDFPEQQSQINKAATLCGSCAYRSAPCRTRTYNPLIKSLLRGLLGNIEHYANGFPGKHFRRCSEQWNRPDLALVWSLYGPPKLS